MEKLKESRNVWEGKSDEWLFERVSNELTYKVKEIHHLLDHISNIESVNTQLLEALQELVIQLKKVDKLYSRDKELIYKSELAIEKALK